MPTNFMDLKCWWGGGEGVMPKYFMDLKKILGGVMPKYFIDLKKCWGGMRPYAKTF